MTAVKGKFQLRVPNDVAAVLKKLHPVIKAHIRSGLQAILKEPYSGKALKDELQGLRSFRVKRYRIIYRIRPGGQRIDLITIGPRKIIYEETLRNLAKNQNS